MSSVWFAQGIGFKKPSWGGFAVSAPPVEEPAAPSPAQPFAGKALGRQIPIVIGTGKVDGIPVIGGARTVSKVTGYETVPAEWNGLTSGFGPSTKQVPITTTETVAALGYLLAYDPFERGYELVRLEVDDEVVFDAENGIGASETFRFYGGRQTTVDPIAAGVIGVNAGSWQNFVMIYLDGYEADQAPSVKAVTSNAATASGGNQVVAWTGQAPSSMDQYSAGYQSAYDPIDGVIYQLLTGTEIAGISSVYLVVLDIETHSERYRVPLADSSDYVSGTPFAQALPGSGYLVVRLAVGSEAASPTRVYDTLTGEIVAEWREDASESIDWVESARFENKWLMAGFDRDASGGFSGIFAVNDLTAGTIEATRLSSFGFIQASVGRSLSGSQSFFVARSDGVHEVTFDGDQWATDIVFTPNGTLTGLHYDSQTGYLIVAETIGGTHNIRYVNVDTGAILNNLTPAVPYFFGENTYTKNLFPRSGSVLMFDGGSDVYRLDIAARSISLFADNDLSGFNIGFFDQSRFSHIHGFGDTKWTVYALPNTIPGAISLQSMLTDIMSLGGYSPDELIFEGFSGLTVYGYVFHNDGPIRSAVQALADIYNFSFSDTGSGFYFKKAPTDGGFVADAALTLDDLVPGKDAAVETTDEADIRTPARLELEYISKEGGYQAMPVSFTMPAITNSQTAVKLSTPLVLPDADAARFVAEKFFDLQQRRREHSFSVTGKPTFVPGDVLTVPSGSTTFTVQVESVVLDPRSMVLEIEARDFQIDVSTTVEAVSLTPFGLATVTLQTQYIHLDIPLVRYSDDLGGAGLVQYGVIAARGQDNWGGGVLYRGETASGLTAQIDQAPHDGLIAICTTALPAPAALFCSDEVSTVTVRPVSGDIALLVSKTEAEVLEGANLAWIGRDGRWEGIGFRIVTDNGDGTYTLSGLTVRGYRGSEVHAGSHVAGDYFILHSPDWVHRLNHPVSDLDQTRYYKAIGLNADPAGGVVLPHVVSGAAETPYAPVNLSAQISGSDIVLGWDHRSRRSAWEFFESSPDSGEASLSFEIDIIDGSTVKRTLTAATNAKTYAAADITADWGTMPASLKFRVHQISAAVGRGAMAEKTATL
ncbi:hypothetical protein EET67_09910 [Pseudaminobacter arsenicus]|uniref:Uncharacterized protein n=1 Tax=Borborobacter arsenicus TaxID=1851146 RepID=A0A432V713_9HYPH|nr:phage tail protein [Pseudaminobacter arsenicus]RUM97920.1 hypothetical protein EET67_09910 [Pseudaminobacter arsenicus]